MLSPEGRCAVKLGHYVLRVDDSANVSELQKVKEETKVDSRIQVDCEVEMRTCGAICFDGAQSFNLLETVGSMWEVGGLGGPN